jgi:uncharacterized repeat protein (TIGR02059 family)
MRNSIILLLLCYSLSISGATYYIDPSGNDSNNGSSGSPWKTLAYACSKATSSGDVIHVNAGTYTETAQSMLAVGISIEGAGVTSIIQSRVGGSSFTIYLYSSSQGTNGNQHISNIKMNGSALTAFGAIKIDRRSNVEIYNCTFVDFNYYGVRFDGDGTGNQPSTYPTGNKFHDNTITNCSGYYPAGERVNGEGKGGLTIDGQDGLLVYNNTITQTGRAAGSNGYCIKGVAGYNKNIKIYNNTLTKEPYDNLTWDFAIELWNNRGGVEIYNNVITAGVDLSGDCNGITQQKGSSTYSVWIHNNTIGPIVQSSYSRTYGILSEQSASDIIIEKNYIKNVWIGIQHPFEDIAGKTLSYTNERISYNIFNNVGYSTTGGDGSGYGIYYTTDVADYICDNVNILNNDFVSGTGGQYGIVMPVIGPTTNLTIRNNIIKGYSSYALYGSGGSGKSLDYLSLENNIFYTNGYTVAGYSSLTPTHNTTQNNLTSNPLFTSSSDFHLQSGSPAIGKGLAITGLTTDYVGSAVKSPPSIGAYENGSAVATPVSPVYTSSTVENATPSLLTMTYNLTLANYIPVGSAFSVLVNSVARTVNTVVISGTKVQLNLASHILPGDIVTISYTKPTSNPIQTTSGGTATSITNQPVINDCGNIAPIAEITSPIVNSTFTSLANITITANAVDPDGSVSMVEFYNGSIKLGSNSIAPYSFTWNNVGTGTYSLTVIATDNLNAKTTSSAISISVVNSNSGPNKHPIVKISNPRKGNTYENISTIEIDATASDPDGTISKVEFYNGQTKLVELTSAPYIYTWKDVATGSYTITAIATDNLSDTTISSPVEFVVGANVKYDANSDIINLYPNPNNGHFSIDFINPLKSEKSEIIITDLAGKQIYDGPVLKEEITKQFDLSYAKAGIYVMMIKDKDILVTKKIIKNS